MTRFRFKRWREILRTAIRKGPLLGFVCLLLGGAMHCQETATPAQGTIRVNVNRVNVGAIVTTADGKFVEGLRREDFEVLDNGVTQTISDFASVDEPAKVLVLIEAGPAVYLLEGGHVHAAYALLDGLSEGDEVAVAKYNDAAEVVSPLSPDKRVAAEAFGRLNFNLGFGALNLSASLEKVLNWLAKTQGKKTVVMLSTGVDTSEPGVTTELLQRLRVGDVRVLAVSLAGEMRAPSGGKKKQAPTAAAKISSEQFATADALLRTLAEATGGRAYFPVNGKEFDAAYAEIAQIVRHEYSLAFSPMELDGKAHRIEVRVSKDGAGVAGWRVDHRWGYLATAREP